MSAALLDAHDVAVRFGGVAALSGVSLDVGADEVVGLIGPNGAGKTTFIDAVCGFVRSTGAVTFDGRPIAALPAHARARLGLARTFQSVELFSDLTVAENVIVAAERVRWWTPLADIVRPRSRANVADVRWALDLLELAEFADRSPDDLSLGQRKLVGVARALAGRPALVFLDEPAAGLDSAESSLLGTRLRRLHDHGIAALLVDHDMSLVLGVCDRVHVLDRGRLLATGRPDEIATNPDVVAAYLGPAVPQ